MTDILLVDDDEDSCLLLAELLALQGETLRTAHDGEEALKLLDERFPSVVVSDIEMPRLDGPAMIYRMFVKDLGRENIPIIFLSGRQDLAKIAHAVGTPYYLCKPFDLAELTKLIGRAVAEAIPPRPDDSFSSLVSRH